MSDLGIVEVVDPLLESTCVMVFPLAGVAAVVEHSSCEVHLDSLAVVKSLFVQSASGLVSMVTQGLLFVKYHHFPEIVQDEATAEDGDFDTVVEVILVDIAEESLAVCRLVHLELIIAGMAAPHNPLAMEPSGPKVALAEVGTFEGVHLVDNEVHLESVVAADLAGTVEKVLLVGMLSSADTAGNDLLAYIAGAVPLDMVVASGADTVHPADMEVHSDADIEIHSDADMEAHCAAGMEAHSVAGMEAHSVADMEVLSAADMEVLSAADMEVHSAADTDVHSAVGMEVHPAADTDVHSAADMEVHPAVGMEVHPAAGMEVHPAAGMEDLFVGMEALLDDTETLHAGM